MDLMKHVNRLFTKAIKKYAEVQGIVIPDFNEFVIANKGKFMLELTYLYSSYEDILFITASSIIADGFPADFDFEIKYRRKPALYLKLGEYDLELVLDDAGSIATAKDDKSWKILAVEAHDIIQENSVELGFFHMAKEAKMHKDRLVKHLGLK